MPEEKKVRKFTVEGKDYEVRVPTVDQIKKANAFRSQTFNEALTRGDLLRDQLEGALIERKLWGDKREEKYQTLRKEILDGEYRLQKGGIKLSEARSIALDMSEKRESMVEMLSSRTDLDSNTCEGKADAARFNFLFSHCLVYGEDGEPYFPKGLDSYLENQDDPVAIKGATEFYYLISDSDNIDNKLPENVFLKKFNFVDNKSRLIDKEGRLIDGQGRHIDENGNYIRHNADGTTTKIDPSGRTVNDDGEFDVDHSPFLSESGEPIDEASFNESEEDAKVKPKRKSRKKVDTESTSES